MACQSLYEFVRHFKGKKNLVARFSVSSTSIYGIQPPSVVYLQVEEEGEFPGLVVFCCYWRRSSPKNDLFLRFSAESQSSLLTTHNTYLLTLQIQPCNQCQPAAFLLIDRQTKTVISFHLWVIDSVGDGEKKCFTS